MRSVFRVQALLRSLGFASAVVFVYATFVWTQLGQQLDASGFVVAGIVGSSPFGMAIGHARTAAVVALAVAAAIAAVPAVIQRRFHTLTTALLLVVASAAIARALRSELPRPYLGDFAYRYNTLPSGHAASAAALVVALLVLLPQGLASRMVNSVAVLVIAGAGMASVTSFAHRPSDVLAAILIVGCLGSVLRIFPELASPPMARISGLWAIGATAAAALLYLALLVSVGGARELFTGLAPTAAILAASAWVLLLGVPVHSRDLPVSSAREPRPRRRLLTPPSG
jgi:hypothetical protein